VSKGERDKIIDGKGISKEILNELATEVGIFTKRYRAPHLAVLIAGDDPASKVYVRNKVRAAEKTGVRSTLIELPADIGVEELYTELDRLNRDTDIDGILVQLPLPSHIDQQRVIERISPHKDVDGFHPYNLGRLASDQPVFIPCTPLGISVLLSKYGVETTGKRVVIVGRSIIVGKPLALLLSRKNKGGNATVTICHSRTEDLSSIAISADILVAAIGKAGMITGDMIKDGAVVIDVGTNRVEDKTREKGYRIAGDVDFDTAYPKVSLITPVPGGVGPMTVTMLMRNTLQAAQGSKGEGDAG
jgi:methylenetetrahydrofolate dehydrogenase (NADP+)/methenyltetrahydrofolate cyclohydrolase